MLSDYEYNASRLSHGVAQYIQEIHGKYKKLHFSNEDARDLKFQRYGCVSWQPCQILRCLCAVIKTCLFFRQWAGQAVLKLLQYRSCQNLPDRVRELHFTNHLSLLENHGQNKLYYFTTFVSQIYIVILCLVIVFVFV